MNCYVNTFQDDEGTDYTVRIEDSSLTEDTPIELGPTPVIISYEGDEDDLYKPVKSVTAKIQVITSSLLLGIYSADPMGRKVTVMNGTVTIFAGYVMPGVWEVPVSSAPHSVEVEAVDPLTQMKYYKFTQENAAYRQIVTADSIIQRCCDKMGIKHYVSDVLNAEDHQLRINEETFLCTNYDDDGADSSTWLEVIEAIARISGCTAMVWQGTLYILSYDRPTTAVSDNSYLYEGWLKTEDGWTDQGKGNGTRTLLTPEEVRTSGYTMQIQPAKTEVVISPRATGDIQLTTDIFNEERIKAIGATKARTYTNDDKTYYVWGSANSGTSDDISVSGIGFATIMRVQRQVANPDEVNYRYTPETTPMLCAPASIAAKARKVNPIDGATMVLSYTSYAKVSSGTFPNLNEDSLGGGWIRLYVDGVEQTDTDIADFDPDDEDGNHIYYVDDSDSAATGSGWKTCKRNYYNVPQGLVEVRFMGGYFSAVSLEYEGAYHDDTTTIIAADAVDGYQETLDIQSALVPYGKSLSVVAEYARSTKRPYYARYDLQYAAPRARIKCTAIINNFSPFRFLSHEGMTLVADTAEVDLRTREITVSMLERHE
jgi:hypothetical protein